MKIVILTGMAAALLLAQDKDTKQSKDTSMSEAKGATSSAIPKEATLAAPNLYRYTDAQGKTWFYRQTPFGVSKWEDKPEVPRAVEVPLTTVSRDLGDAVEFQRPTPFGISKWVTKKTELTEQEKELVAADEAKRAADKTAKEKQERQ